MSSAGLELLATHREAILKAELGALLHNLGKLSEEFVGQQTGGPGTYGDFDYQLIAGVIRQLWDEPPTDAKLHDRAFWSRYETPLKRIDRASRDPVTLRLLDPSIKALFRLRDLVLPVPFEQVGQRLPYAIGDFIDFQDNDWYSQKTPPRRIEAFFPTSWATMLLQTSHHCASGGEKETADPANPPIHAVQQSYGTVAVATAFGAEQRVGLDLLTYLRDALLSTMQRVIWRGLVDPDARATLRAAAGTILNCSVGDTRRPINDVTIWDLGSSAAALWKAGAAKVILSAPGSTLDWDAIDKDRFTWRLLGVRVDGLGFVSRAQHVTDLLGRRHALAQALDRVRDGLEIDYPLGNEVYRDENGSVFIVPDLADLLALAVPDQQQSLRAHLEGIFDDTSVASLAGEIDVTPTLSASVRGRDLQLGPVLRERPNPLAPRPRAVADWWDWSPAPVKRAEVCTVCQIRPQGWLPNHGYDKRAEDRSTCGVCLARRGQRCRSWLERGLSNATIWIDEVADINGRAALVVGRFDLDDWLSGDLIKTLSVGTPEKPLEKNPSFARIRRVVDTTTRFWQDVEHSISLATGRTGPRLRIRGVFEPAADRDLAGANVYDLMLDGRTLSVVWDDKSKSFVTADNLRYAVKLRGYENAHWQTAKAAADKLDQLLTGKTVDILEPGGYRAAALRIGSLVIGSRGDSVEATAEKDYTPTVPLLTEPRSFMALVPADRALPLVELIAARYGREMGRVRDRLRLDVGLVIFQRRIPLPAVLDAGRRMLEMPTGSERWDVDDVRLTPNGRGISVRFANDTTWRYSTFMGDDVTPDVWYPFFRRLPTKEDDRQLVHARRLKGGDQVLVSPSRFDWEYLDSAAQRVNIAYDETGRRVDERVRHRPYLLDDVARLGQIWLLLPGVAEGDPLTTQIRGLVAVIEAKRELWQVGSGSIAEGDPVFAQFVEDALGETGEGWWRRRSDDERDLLKRAAVTGMLTDTVDLYLSIIAGGDEEDGGRKRHGSRDDGVQPGRGGDDRGVIADHPPAPVAAGA